MIALILGGGAGSRLYPLTENRSKPAVPLAGKYRLIDIPISNCLNSDVRRMFVLTQFNSASLNRHIKNSYNFDHFSNGFVDVLAAEQTRSNQEWFQGTADAVRQSMKHLMNHQYEHVLILSGDQLYQMDYRELLEDHIDKGADVSIATTPVTAKDATGFGIMKVNKEGIVEKFIEKPTIEKLANWTSPVETTYQQSGKHFLASMGIYIFNKAALLKLFADYPEANDFGKEIIPNAIYGNYTVSGYAFGDYWTDIGTIDSFMEANLALTDPIPSFNLFSNIEKIYTHSRILPPAKIRKSILDNVILGGGNIIEEATIENAVIGVRARIESNTYIKNAIIMGIDKYESLEDIAIKKVTGYPPHLGIGENCHIEEAIIDKNCAIGNHVIIKGGKGLQDIETKDYCIRNGIIIIKEGAIIPNETIIGHYEKITQPGLLEMA
ncbi:MAG: glucose-1-phosphate adenylyltransferase [Saprospiraceae bacterium]